MAPTVRRTHPDEVKKLMDSNISGHPHDQGKDVVRGSEEILAILPPDRACVWFLEPPEAARFLFSSKLNALPKSKRFSVPFVSMPFLFVVVCVWFDICSTVSVVAPTVPDTPG